MLPKGAHSNVLNKKCQLRESKAFSKSTDNKIPDNVFWFLKNETSSRILIF